MPGQRRWKGVSKARESSYCRPIPAMPGQRRSKGVSKVRGKQLSNTYTVPMPGYPQSKAEQRCIKGEGKQLSNTYTVPMPGVCPVEGGGKVCQRRGKAAIANLCPSYARSKAEQRCVKGEGKQLSSTYAIPMPRY